jgi:hypothetical protein
MKSFESIAEIFIMSVLGQEARVVEIMHGISDNGFSLPGVPGGPVKPAALCKLSNLRAGESDWLYSTANGTFIQVFTVGNTLSFA